MKPISIAVLALALSSLAPAAGAQSAVLPMTVDAVSVGPGSVSVTGVVQGDSAPSTRTVTFATIAGTDAQKVAALEGCRRFLLLAMGKPGQYVARIDYNVCSVSLIAP